MKNNKSGLTSKLRQNWRLDALLGVSALVAILSSLYFLVFPNSGYQGGRNPYYNLRVILDRHEWDVLHTWAGIAMIIAALVHIIIHWEWITATSKRTWQVIVKKRRSFGSRLTYNIILDATTALSFIVCGISSLYFLAFPESGPVGRMFIFNKITWDLIHTWSGVLFTMAAILHFALHWKWIVNITKKVFNNGFKKTKSDASTDLTPVEDAA
jgi:hypothetical protein